MDKICNVCLISKPLSEFYFRKEIGTYRKNCKKCKPLISRADIADRIANQVTKICKHCGLDKPIGEYQKTAHGKLLQPYCKPCDAERKRVYGIKNKERLKEVYRKRYIEKIKPFIVKKIRVLKSKELIQENNRRYRNLPEVKLKKAECDRKYREKNKEKLNSRKKEYYDLKGLEMAKAWQKRNMNNIGFRIKKNLRGRIYVALKRGVKSESTMQLLGCSIEYFKQYFESLFTDGMNWDVYLAGGIHIDHIIPCKHFDLKNPTEQRKCFHYSNLQPLWAIDNLKKGVNKCQSFTYKA